MSTRTIRSEYLPPYFREILRCTVGSELHGITVPGTDDHDELGVVIEPPGYVIGLRDFEQVQWRTQPEGVRSGHGDVDRVQYSLRKFVRLCLGGNPTVIQLLYVRAHSTLVSTATGAQLQSLASALLSRHRVAAAFAGYMAQQRMRLERSLAAPGTGHHVPSRPELIAAYGFDTKYAGHLIRLGLQGVELLTTGQLTLPLPRAQREHVVEIRTGGVPAARVLEEADDLLVSIEGFVGPEPCGSPLAEEPNLTRVEHFLIAAYEQCWQFDRSDW